MGLLSEGSPLSWFETKALADHVRSHGVTQFINHWPEFVQLRRPKMKWGDEIEYCILYFDKERKSVQLSLRAEKMLSQLQAEEADNPEL